MRQSDNFLEELFPTQMLFRNISVDEFWQSLEALDEHVRYLNISEREDMDDEQLRDWIRQAADLPGDDTF